jgi:hypothetical protein
MIFGRFDGSQHFLLAKPLHLAIMCGQLGNERDAGLHRKFDNAGFLSELGCVSS